MQVTRVTHWISLSILIVLAGCGGSEIASPGFSNSQTLAPEISAQPIAATDGTINLTSQPLPVRMKPQLAVELPLRTVSGSSLEKFEPLDLPAKQASWSPEDLVKQASAFESVLPSNRVSNVLPPHAVFTPDLDPQLATSNNGLAFAIYRFNLLDYASEPNQTIGLSWSVQPVDFHYLWIGLGSVSAGAWDWFEGPADGVLTIDSFAPYIAGNGTVHMVIALMGTEDCVLEEIRIGDTELRGLGGIPEVVDPDAMPPLSSPNLPSSMDLTPGCSEVNDQGQVGSCTAFAIADGAYNYELNKIYGDYGWDLEDPFNRVSPKYLYIETGIDQGLGCPEDGRYLAPAVAWLQSNGIATELNAPYGNPSPPPTDWCVGDWSTAAQTDASLLDIESYTTFDPSSATGVQTIKTIIANQLRPVIWGTALDWGFMYYSPGEVWTYEGPPIGYHAMLIVGYDDNKDGGALKVRNSWSSDWGDEGYVWVSYSTLVDYPPQLYMSCNTLSDEYDNEVALRFCANQPELFPPTNVAASDGSFSDRIRVTWTKSENATGYKIFRDTQDNLVAILEDVSSWDDMGIVDYFGHIYWVAAFNGSFQSAHSSPDAGFLAQAPDIVEVSPTTGNAGEEITFFAVVYGTTPMTYSWDFNGGAIPNTTGNASPQVVLGAAGSYDASLTVTNDYGQDIYAFDLIVAGASGYTVDGYVKTASGLGIANVEMQLSDGLDSAFTDVNGHWAVSGVQPGLYVVSPQKTGYSFIPTQRQFIVVDKNLTVQNFTGTAEGANITIDSLTTSKKTHLNDGSEGAATLSVSSTPTADDVEWLCTLGAVAGSGDTVSWTCPNGSAPQKVTVTCTVFSGPYEDSASLYLYVTDEDIKAQYGDNGYYIDFNNLPCLSIPTEPYLPFSDFIDGNSVVQFNRWELWCYYCRTELATFNTWCQDYTAYGYSFIGNNISHDLGTVEAYFKDNEYSAFENYYGDINSSVWVPYGYTSSIPYNLLIDMDGYIRLTQLGMIKDASAQRWEEVIAQLTGAP